MEFIRESAQFVLGYMGGAQKKMKGKKYRFNKYMLRTEVEDGEIFFNTMTGCIVLLKPYEVTKLFCDEVYDFVNVMTENYFLVPEEFDEDTIIDRLRESNRIPITCNTLDVLDSYTILTTTDCNARCFYCYEKGFENKHHMTMDTAEKVVKFILERSWSNAHIGIGWFGGEPLYNQEVIDLISSRLRSSGREFSSSMISNAYLFKDPKLARKAKREWNLRSIQVTLDGTEEVYNKAKRYIYKDDPSPFMSVIQSIHNLLAEEIPVSVRLNCDTYNLEDLKKLIEYLTGEFKGFGLFSAYVWPLFETETYHRTSEKKDVLYKGLNEINEILRESGFMVGDFPSYGVKYINCMADNNQAVVINPDGDLSLCEHHITSGFIGHIDRPLEKDWDRIKKWHEYVESTEKCYSCPIRPMCVKLPECPGGKMCDDKDKVYQIDMNTEQLRAFYDRYLIEKEKEYNAQMEEQKQCSCKNKNR